MLLLPLFIFFHPYINVCRVCDFFLWLRLPLQTGQTMFSFTNSLVTSPTKDISSPRVCYGSPAVASNMFNGQCRYAVMGDTLHRLATAVHTKYTGVVIDMGYYITNTWQFTWLCFYEIGKGQCAHSIVSRVMEYWMKYYICHVCTFQLCRAWLWTNLLKWIIYRFPGSVQTVLTKVWYFS